MKKAKFILLALVGLFTFFFSSDFGLINVEKTSIITAIGIDYQNNEYLITAQTTVPEATDTNAENQKAEISATGKTVGEALKNTGDITGWFPKLAFCNLIVIGNGLKDTNVVNVLDYFAKSLRIQDSATIVLAEGKAQELLTHATPLDNISSFAIQKILLKNPGFDREVCPIDIKTFCVGHYSSASSAFMPIVKIIKADASDGNSSSSGQGGSSGGSGAGSAEQSGSSSSGEQPKGETTKNKDLFDARYTALFKNGVKVGELSPELTVMFNALRGPINDTTLSVNDVQYNNQNCNFLLTVKRGTSSIKLRPTQNEINVDINLSLFCKISDVNTEGTDFSLSHNEKIPFAVKKKATTMLTERIYSLMDKSVSSGCDLLNLKQKLYRHHHEQYSKFKDNYLSKLKINVNVSVYGQE